MKYKKPFQIDGRPVTKATFTTAVDRLVTAKLTLSVANSVIANLAYQVAEGDPFASVTMTQLPAVAEQIRLICAEMEGIADDLVLDEEM